MSDDSISKTLTVTLGVCLVCSIFVASAAVGLRDLQEKNKRVDKIKNILQAGQLYDENRDIFSLYNEKIEPVLIELASGNRIAATQFTQELNIDAFDIKTIADHPSHGEAVVPEIDIARIKHKPKYMVVYLTKKNKLVDKIIFPVYGKGLWSTIYGFIALGSDLSTVQGLTFYEHGETPGLGGLIDNLDWRQSWQGKEAFDNTGRVAISIIKGKVAQDRPQAIHQIDGLSGATLTSRGVDQLIKFWLGKDGYGPFINNMRLRGDNEKI